MAGDAGSDREALTNEAHTRHIVVWDVPATVERGGSYRLKVGVRCAAQCMPADWLIEVRVPEGASVVAHPYRAVTDERGRAELDRNPGPTDAELWS